MSSGHRWDERKPPLMLGLAACVPMPVYANLTISIIKFGFGWGKKRQSSKKAVLGRKPRLRARGPQSTQKNLRCGLLPSERPKSQEQGVLGDRLGRRPPRRHSESHLQISPTPEQAQQRMLLLGSLHEHG